MKSAPHWQSGIDCCNVYVDKCYGLFESYPTSRVTLNLVIFESYVACVHGKGWIDYVIC